MYMLWLKLFFGSNIFEPVCFLFCFVTDYDYESETKENKKLTGLKFFNVKKNLNHNI